MKKVSRLVSAMTASVFTFASMAAITLGSQPATAAPAATTAPSTTSATALYASNWQNLTAIWEASQLNQNDNGTSGPRIAELRTANQWSTNQIVDYSGFFKDVTDNVSYDQIHGFASSAYLDENGVLNSTYGKYSGSTLPITIKRDYVAVPNEPFLVVRYTLTNPTATPLTWSLLDQVHLSNTSAETNVTANYDSTRTAMFADMTASGQDAVALGAFQAPTSYQVGNDANCTASDPTSSAWCQYDQNSTLSNNSTLSTPNIDLGFENSVTIPANGSQTEYYYLAAGSTLAAAQGAADTARGKTGAYWFNATASDYANWLSSGTKINTSDPGVNVAYLRNLVVIKNSQNPGTGLIPAATNPGSYGYKAWMRDSAFDAMALDAAGHYSEAALFWNWMANNQLSNGTWHTTYDEWSGNFVSFVEPEYDSIGQFLVGVLKHYQDTGDTAFLAKMWPIVQNAANFVQNNIGTNGLGPADASIWEEAVQDNIFTEAFYVAGLRAAATLASVESAPAAADSWNGAASTILSAIQRSDTWSPAGMWNANGYYDRGINTDGSVNTLLDSSQQILSVLGVIDPHSTRATTTESTIENSLTHDSLGIARYTNDQYYYNTPWNPAGNEALAAEPVWPNMTMFDAIEEMYTGNTATAFSRLQWYASRSGVGYMPPGEAVSWVTSQPIVSTMAEPLTASSFIMAALTYTGNYDARVYPTNANAGAYAPISVTTTPSNDWSQYSQIPYYAFPQKNTISGSSMTDINKVYVSNDASNIYVRVDNASGSLSAFNSSPKFAVLVYAQDLNHSTTLSPLTTAEYGRTLDHPMNYMVGRWSDSQNYSAFSAGSSGWNFTSDLNTIAPQWDTSTGRVEAAIPISALSSTGSASTGSWTYLDVELAYQNPATGAWVDDDLGALHYQLTAQGSPWIYGNN